MVYSRYCIMIGLLFFACSAIGQQLWNMNKLQQAPSYQWIDEDTASVRSLYYRGEAFGKLDSTDVFAYYSTPGMLSGNRKEDVNLPAIVLVHGGMGKAYKEWVVFWAQQGYAAIAMDLAGNGADAKRLANAGPDQTNLSKFNSIDSALNRQWVYHTVSNVIRAHSLIRSFKEVDTARTAITGISWGGFITCIVSGVDLRFKAVAPVYGCGFIYEPDGVFYKNLKSLRSDEAMNKWIGQYDPSNYLYRSHAPFLWVGGAKDFAYQPTIMSKSCKLVEKQSNFRFLADMPHNQAAGSFVKEIVTFMDQHLQGRDELPQISSVRISKEGAVTAGITRYSKITQASLFYTEDTLLPYKDRVWKELPAKVSGNDLRVDHLPEKATIWLLNVTDDRGNTVSSEYMFGTADKPLPDTLHSEDYIFRYGNLKSTFSKLNTSKKLNVSFLGGSITNMTGWRNKVCDYLSATYPDVTFTFNEVAIPSLGSIAHAFRLKHDLWSKGKTDLLFLESAVNDRGVKEEYQRRSLEGIIRACKRQNPSMDIIIMAFVDQSKIKDYNSGKVPLEVGVHNDIAKYYRLPFLNLALEMSDRIKNGEFTWEHDFISLHPSPFGHQLYFNTIRTLFEGDKYLKQGGAIMNPAILPPMDKMNYSHADYVDIHKVSQMKEFNITEDWNPADGKPTRSGFVHVPVLTASKPGASFEFSFYGNAIGLGTITGPDVGIIEYSIDGKLIDSADLFIPASKDLHHPYYLILADGLQLKKHTLKIKVTASHNTGSLGNACRIAYFLVNQ